MSLVRFRSTVGVRYMVGGPQYLAARKRLLLSGLDVAQLRGLEIGALSSPLVEKNEGFVRYVDHASTSELATKYAGQIDARNIRNVDYVWSTGQRLSTVLQGETFDYIVASHVIEHVPNLIGWVNQLSECLSPGGSICLAVPDKRFTFDIARPLSTVGEMIQAHLLKSEVPSIKQIWDNFTLARNVQNGPDKRTAPYLHSRSAAWELVTAVQDGQYVDCHCWIFTPRSFVDAFEALVFHKLVSVAPTWMQTTIEGEHEFLVRLQKTGESKPLPDPQKIRDLASGDSLENGL